MQAPRNLDNKKVTRKLMLRRSRNKERIQFPGFENNHFSNRRQDRGFKDCGKAGLWGTKRPKTRQEDHGVQCAVQYMSRGVPKLKDVLVIMIANGLT